MIKRKYLSIRITEEQYNQVLETAEKEGLSISDYMRRKLGIKDTIRTKKTINFKIDADNLTELQRIAEEQGISLNQLLAQKLKVN